jgi:hypothetical protein
MHTGPARGTGRQQAAEASEDHTRAEDNQAAAEHRTHDERATAQRLRAELDQLRVEHRDELTQLRRDTAEERATQQLRALLTQLEPLRRPATSPAGDEPAEPAAQPHDPSRNTTMSRGSARAQPTPGQFLARRESARPGPGAGRCGGEVGDLGLDAVDA